MGQIDFEKITTPLGLIAFILFCVFGVLLKKGAPAWWIYGTFILASISLVVALILAYKFTDTNKTLTSNTTDGKLKCESLIGSYGFHSPYIYIKRDDMKGTAIDASWIATTCKKNDDDTYSLEGDDTSKHLVEVMIEGAYREVATVETKYKSTITIDKDGVLTKRIINNPRETLPASARLDNNKFKKYDKFINSKVEEYKKLVGDKHKNTTSAFCYPVSYKDIYTGRTFIVAICSDYIRTLVKN
jgi:hypothetical protein